MSAEDLENYETEMELSLYREYRDVVSLFSHVVETERRFYLANSVEVKPRGEGGEVEAALGLDDRRLGLGRLPPGPLRQEREGRHLQGRQRRGAGQGGPGAAEERRLRRLSPGRRISELSELP